MVAFPHTQIYAGENTIGMFQSKLVFLHTIEIVFQIN